MDNLDGFGTAASRPVEEEGRDELTRKPKWAKSSQEGSLSQMILATIVCGQERWFTL